MYSDSSSSSYCTREQLADSIVCELQRKRFEIFKSQDVEKGYYDVTLEIEGKQLYAHKFVIAAVSETMDAWLSDRWSNKDEAIKIETYSYNNFYQFLRFLYSGDCDISEENVFQLVDIAEFYGVELFKDFCEKFLCEMDLNIATIEEMSEFALKYSLKEWTRLIRIFICNKCGFIIRSENFLNHKKTFVELLTSVGTWEREAHFKAVYKWAEHQVLKQKPVDDDGSYNVEEAIKNELINILPRIQYHYMTLEFLMDFVVEKGFCLNPTELSNFFSQQQINEKSKFERVYQLAEKQALLKQKMSSDADNFNVNESIIADLAQIIPRVLFCKMDKEFVYGFVVNKGILSKEQADHVFDTKVIIENERKVITGIFTDDFGIYDAIQNRLPRQYETCQRNNLKIRYTCLRHAAPSTPSPVQKMVGIEWYLCLEKEYVTFKHHTLVDRNDYLIAEMKGNPEFQITPGKKTTLTVSYRNLEGLI